MDASRQIGLAAAVWLALAGAAAASPYRIPDLDAASHWEIKLLAEAETSRDEDSLAAPALDLTAPIRPGLETSVTFGRGWVRPAGRPVTSGWLDTEWAVKWEVLPLAEDGHGLGVTTEPAVIAPTASHGLGDGAWRFEVPVMAGAQFGRVGLMGLVGYAHAFGRHEDEASAGVLATYEVSDRFSLGAELFEEAPTGRFADRETFVDLGFKWEFAEGLELQGRIGRTVERPAGEPPATSFAVYLEKAF